MNFFGIQLDWEGCWGEHDQAGREELECSAGRKGPGRGSLRWLGGAVLAGLGGVWRPGVHGIEGQGEAGRGSWGRTGGWLVSPACAESPCREIFLNFA